MSRFCHDHRYTADAEIMKRNDVHVDVAKLVLEYVKVLAWPVFAASLLWILRGKIKEIADRLTRVETPAGSAEFAAAAAHVLDEVEEAALSSGTPNVVAASVEISADTRLPAVDSETSEEPSTNPTTPDERPTPARRGAALFYEFDHPSDADYLTADAAARLIGGSPFDAAMQTVSVSPRGAVLEAWWRLDFLCREALSDHFRRETLPSNPRAVLPRNPTYRQLERLGLSESTLDTFTQLRELRNRAVHSGEVITRSAAEDFVRSCRIVAMELGRAWEQT